MSIVRRPQNKIARLLFLTLFTLGLAWPSNTLGLQPAPVRGVRLPTAAGADVAALQQGVLAAPGGKAVLQFTIRNIGTLGSDTFDLTAASAWPVTFYAVNGTTLLTDTNSNVTVDTGALAMGSTFTGTVSAQVPLTATAGSFVVMTVTVRSSVTISSASNLVLQAAVPAPFAQVYSDHTDRALSLLLAQPKAQIIKKATEDGHVQPPQGYSPDMAVARTAAGGFIYALANGGIEYAILDKAGNLIRPATILFDPGCAPITIFTTCTETPVAAATPDGHIALAWATWTASSGHSSSTAVYFAVLDPSGAVINGPGVVDSGQQNLGCPGVGRFVENPRLVGTTDNHFVMAWEADTMSASGACPLDREIRIMATNSSGVALSGPLQLTQGNSSLGYVPFGLSALNSNRVLLNYADNPGANLYYAVLDSAAHTVKGQTALGVTGGGLVGTQLSTGAIDLAWVNQKAVQFASLDAGYNLVSGPITLTSPAGAPNADPYYPAGSASSLSAAPDADGHAILTWNESGLNLYYALVNGSGGVVTPPTIFHSTAGANPDVFASSAGQGLTAYDFVPAAGVDLATTLNPARKAVSASDAVDLAVRVTNFGLTQATGTVLTATLASGLTYLGDTSGITPTFNGNNVSWGLGAMDYPHYQAFTLTVGVPVTAAVGAQYALGLAVTADQADASPADNSSAGLLFVPYQTFLPIKLTC